MAGEPAQIVLGEQGSFSFYGLNEIDRTQPRYHATGKLVQKHRPEVYRIAVDLLAAGRHSIREMCDLLHISNHTLESIAADQAETLATLRARAARRNLELHAMSLDQLERVLPTMQDGAKIAVVAGITAEKSQLFAGEATARLERIEPVSIVERLSAFVERVEKKVAAREIGCGPPKNLANGAPILADSEADGVDRGGSITSDNEAHIKSADVVAIDINRSEPDISISKPIRGETDPIDSSPKTASKSGQFAGPPGEGAVDRRGRGPEPDR